MKTDARDGKGTGPKPLPAPNSDFYSLLTPWTPRNARS